MGFSISTHNLAHIRSHTAAHSYWERTKHFKNTPGKPIGRRADTGKRIEKIGDDYRLIYHSTPLVTYHKNGDITLIVYPSQSSTSFLNHFASSYTQSSYGGKYYLHAKTGHYYPTYTDCREFRFDKDGKLLSPPPRPAQEWVGDKTKMAKTRKLLKPFQTWQDVSLKMGVDGARFKLYYRYAMDKTDIATALLNNPEDSSMYLKVCEAFSSSEELRNTAYRISGAKTLVDVPFDRLPRRE